MTFRIYIRWPKQRVSEKTTTESSTVAALALKELTDRSEELKQQGAIGIVFSRDGKQLQYVDLNTDDAPGHAASPAGR